MAGVDSSTQSCKVLVVEPDTGRVVRQAGAAHPDGTEIDPEIWWDALGGACDDADLTGVRAVSVGAQQHGMVALDREGAVVRPALLWNDVRSGPQARAMVERLGAQTWADSVGSVPLPSFTVTKLAWLAEHEPDHAAAVSSVLLPHDWLTWRLLGRSAEPTTDRSDASGTGYWSSTTEQYRLDLFELALGHQAALPHVLAPSAEAGRTAGGLVVGAGAGDNAAAALGLGLERGEVAVSLGTSGAVFAATDEPTHDGTGIVAGFADATGGQLPLACTLNAARVLTATATMLGTDLAGLDRLAAAGRSGRGWVDPPAVPRRRAHPGPARGQRQPARPAAGVDDAGQPGPGRGARHAVRARRRAGRHAPQRSPRGARRPDRRRLQVPSGSRGRPRHLRHAGRRTGRGRVRRAGCRPPGGVGPQRGVGAAHLEARRDRRDRAVRTGLGAAVRERYDEARRSTYGI